MKEIIITNLRVNYSQRKEKEKEREKKERIILNDVLIDK